MSKEIIEKLKAEISGFKSEIKAEKVGRVYEVGDGVCRVWGLSDVMASEMVEIETDAGMVSGIALNLEEDSVGVVILGDPLKVKEGHVVRGSGRVLSVRVGREMVGRVVNALGEPIDGRGPLFASEKDGVFYPVEKIAPGVITRESVNTPLHTGIKAIDAMIPIGRGQRELIIGDRQIGKSAIAIDAIVNQQNDTGRRTPFCIYVAVGQRDPKVAKIVAELEKKGAMKYTVVVAASASSPASLQYLAPFTGAAIGEFFMDQGEDALVIYDDLTKHANAYRQISLLLRRPPGREAFPGDIFYLHSRLLVRPAVNVGLSVSRVGSAAQTQAMKKVAGRLRLDLAQFRELQAFVQFATDLDEATKKRIVRGQVLTELLEQNDFEPMPFERQVVVLYAGGNGYLDGIELPEIQNFQKKFLDYIDKMHKGILEAIAKSGELAVDVEEKLKRAIEETRKM